MSDPRPRASVYVDGFNLYRRLLTGCPRVDKRTMPVHPVRLDEEGELVKVNVRKTEEKGSDVNLAAHMLVDAFQGESGVCFLLSNDSDFTDAFRLVRDEAGAEIGLIRRNRSPSTGRARAPR